MTACCRTQAAKKRGPLRWLTACLLATAATALAGTAYADPPTRVGRIAFIEGAVSLHPAPDQEWGAAELNDPMAPDTSLWTEPGAHAEVEIGRARVQLDGGTELDITAIDDKSVELSVPQGRIDIDLFHHDPDERLEITTPRGTVDLGQDGRYRIIAGTDQEPTRVAIFAGQAILAGPSSNVTFNQGEETVITSIDPLNTSVDRITEDAFDHWGEERARKLDAAAVKAASYVSPDMTGYADLEAYGSWRETPDYGRVWVPTHVDAGWAPYRQGHWRWVAPWGWTWVDAQPWGFAPFHYGRWAQVEGRWAWIPGPVAQSEPPVYAPALVAFIADPGAVVEGGPAEPCVGWVPLGPRELYTPTFALAGFGGAGAVGVGVGLAAGGASVSFDYFRALNRGVPAPVVQAYIHNGAFVDRTRNVSSVTNITNVTYVNQRYATVVQKNTFVEARPVQQAALQVKPGAPIRPAPTVAAAALPTAPTPAAVLGHSGAPAAAAPTPKLQPRPTSPAAKQALEHSPMVHPAAATVPMPGAVPQPNQPGVPPKPPHPGEPVVPTVAPGSTPPPGTRNQPAQSGTAPGSFPHPGAPQTGHAEQPEAQPQKPAAAPGNLPRPGTPQTRHAEQPGAQPQKPVAAPGNLPRPGAPQTGHAEQPEAQPQKPTAAPGNLPHPGAPQTGHAEQPGAQPQKPVAAPGNLPRPGAPQTGHAEQPEAQPQKPAAAPGNLPHPGAPQTGHAEQPEARPQKPVATPGNLLHPGAPPAHRPAAVEHRVPEPGAAHPQPTGAAHPGQPAHPQPAPKTEEGKDKAKEG